MNKPPTSLPARLSAVADQVRPVDLYDRVLHTSRGLRRRRNAGGALTGMLLVALAVAALWPVVAGRGSDPVIRPTPSPTPTLSIQPVPPEPVLPSRFVYSDPQHARDNPVPTGWHGIYVWDGSGRERKISDVDTPAVPIVSPDLRRLAWIDPDGVLILANLDGSARQELGNGWCDVPVWAPSSDTVYAARMLDDGTLTLQAVDPDRATTNERLGVANAGRCEVAISSTGLTMAYFDTSEVLRMVSRDETVGWETRELSLDRWRDPEFDDWDLTVTGVSPDGSWALVNYVPHELAGTFRESWPGAYDERINTATGVSFSFFGGYEGGEAFGLFLPDGNLLSRFQIGMGPDDRLIAYRPADVRQNGPYVDATVYVQGMALVGVG